MRKTLRSSYKKSRERYQRRSPKYYTKEDIFISRMASILMVPRHRIISIFSQRAKTTIRLNGLKGNPKEIYNEKKSKKQLQKI